MSLAQQQRFEELLRDYDFVLDTLGGESLEKSFHILKPKSAVVTIVGPPDATFARARGMNFFMVFVFGLLSRKVHRLARERDVEYSFLFMQPDGRQLAEIGRLLESGKVRPVIDKVFPFDQAKEALAYLEKGRAKGKVVVQIR
jgi:NADPH:quinone reductase-like Zn-dependent oxidoreductase